MPVGPSPFNKEAQEPYEHFKRRTKKYTDKNWDVKGWKKPAMRQLTSALGNTYSIPEDDYQEYLTFFRSAKDSEITEKYSKSGRYRDIASPADYVDYAFGGKTKAPVTEQEGCGHITKLWYSRRYQVLKVQFWNDTICAFFNVPVTVAATLMALAQSGTTHNRADKKGRLHERHALGIYFWDLVRIRGTVHGSRYKFEYIQDNNSGGLPGRPFGSGEDFWYTETSPNKTLQAQIDALQSELNALEAISPEVAARLQAASEALHQLKVANSQSSASGAPGRATADQQAKIAEIEDLVLKAARGEILSDQDYKNVESKLDSSKKHLNEELANLKAAQYDVTRKVRAPFGNLMTGVPEELEYDDSAMFRKKVIGYDNAGNPVFDYQPMSYVSALQAEGKKQAAYARIHNAERNIARNWNVDKVDELIENLDQRGILNSNQFYTKFPGTDQQFDVLKSRGFIPPNAVYRE